MKSDTPRTNAETVHRDDAYEIVNPPEWKWVVPSDFARQLERELNEAKAHISTLEDEISQLREANLELTKTLNNIAKK